MDRLANVAYRLKRLRSIEDKLRRLRGMALSRMQDVGGCRVMLSRYDAIDAVGELARALGSDGGGQEVRRVADYIQNPKPDGYRGVHLVFRFQAAEPSHAPWNGYQIELQIRTRHQHAWATAVETIDALVHTRLKVGGPNNGNWSRFFALMASLMALVEDRPTVPGTPQSAPAIWTEAEHLAVELDVDNWLAGLMTAVGAIRFPADSGYLLLILDGSERAISVQAFSREDTGEAQDAYLSSEGKFESRPDVQVCLVAADSIAALRSSYPNYFLDAQQFLEFLAVFRGSGSYAQREPPDAAALVNQLRGVFGGSGVSSG